jgi:hypothetical protein
MQVEVQLLIDVEFEVENLLFGDRELPFLSNEANHSVVGGLDRLLQLCGQQRCYDGQLYQAWANDVRI